MPEDELGINFDDVPDFKVVDEGPTTLELVGGELKKAKEGPNEYINWKFKVLEEGEDKDSILFSTSMVRIYKDDGVTIDVDKTKNSVKYLKKFLVQLGYQWPKKRKFNPAEDPEKMGEMGLKIIGNVEIGEYNGQENNSIKSFAAIQ
jgi:hypothetical protein